MSSNDLADRIGISRHDVSRLDVAVLAPCYNEEHAIAKVVADFHAALPAAAVFAAAVYAYDNNSTDGTVAAAGSASKLSTWQDGLQAAGARRSSWLISPCARPARNGYGAE